jgi:hypothetical protein
MRAVIQICITDVGLAFDRASGESSKSYLYLQAKDFNFDIGLMEHGPAIQMAIHSVKLSDRQSRTVCGHDVDLISITGPNEVI